MPHESDPRFRVLHALRIKGFAKVDALADLAALRRAEVERHLEDFQAAGLARFREPRSLWQLTTRGREEHAAELVADAGHLEASIRPHYDAFLALDGSFKELCGDWQLRDGAPNDHTDPAYDRDLIARLLAIDADAGPEVGAMGAELARLAPYGPRLSTTARLVAEGDHHLFTGVMCGSYHDVWMELHEDLILTLGIDRAAEGVF